MRSVVARYTPCFCCKSRKTPNNTNISILTTARALAIKETAKNRLEVCRIFPKSPPALVGRAKVWFEVRQILAGPIWIDILPMHIQMWTMTFICLCCICSFLFMIHTNGMTNFMNHTSHSSHIFAPAEVDSTVVRRVLPQILQVRSLRLCNFFSMWKFSIFATGSFPKIIQTTWATKKLYQHRPQIAGKCISDFPQFVLNRFTGYILYTNTFLGKNQTKIQI